jgi:hypothetical protein
MTDLSSDELAERIIRSLKANSAEFARKERAQRLAPIRRVLVLGLVFAGGFAAGVLVMSLY